METKSTTRSVQEAARLGALSKQGLLTIVVFGASGDLAKKKTFPALFNLYRHGLLPRYVSVVGYGRSPLTTDKFHEGIREKLPKSKADDLCQIYGHNSVDHFLERCSYVQGSYDNPEDFKRFHEELEKKEEEVIRALQQDSTNFACCSSLVHAADVSKLTVKQANRIFYLAVPPNQFLQIAQMSSAHLRVNPRQSKQEKDAKEAKKKASRTCRSDEDIVSGVSSMK